MCHVDETSYMEESLRNREPETDYVTNTANQNVSPPVPGVKFWHKYNVSGGDIAMTHSHTHSHPPTVHLACV